MVQDSADDCIVELGKECGDEKGASTQLVPVLIHPARVDGGSAAHQ